MDTPRLPTPKPEYIVRAERERDTKITYLSSGIIPVTLTRRGEQETPINVNWSKVATYEPIIEWEDDARSDDQIAETVGTMIVLDCGIAFEVKEAPDEIDKIVREVLLPRVFKKE